MQNLNTLLAATLLCILSFSIIASSIANLTSIAIIYSTGTIELQLTYPLHIEGRYIKNSKGEIVYLRGVNKAGFLDSSDGFWSAGSDDWYTYYGRWNQDLVKTNLQGMKNWGINVLRLPINIDWWLKDFQGTATNGSSNIRYRDSIKQTIDLASIYGIYVVIVPWNVKSGSGQANLPFPPYQGSAADVIPDVASWINFWLNVSQTLRNCNNLLLELHNEPAGSPSDLKVWFDAAEACINALRTDGDNRIIIIQWGYCAGFDNDNWLDVWYKEGRRRDNVLFSTHIYRRHGSFGDQFAPTDIDFIRNQLISDKYLYALNNLSAPIWIGEIGAWGAYTPDQGYNDPSIQTAELEYFRNTLMILKGWSVGYAVWEWFPEWGSTPGRAWGIISKDWKKTAPFTPPLPGTIGQIIVADILS
ncbi:MAG: cellulase family glycosylhydrolase [Candidatus Bathyarchaeia archaeon]